MSPREALEYLIASIIYMYIWRCYESQARRWKEAEGGSDVRGREREKVSPNQALPFGMSDT